MIHNISAAIDRGLARTGSWVREHKEGVTRSMTSEITPLCATADNQAVAEILRNAGTVSVGGHRGLTLLEGAAHWGHHRMVEWCLTQRASANAQTNLGMTPATCAAEQGHVTVVTRLIPAGADETLRTHDGDSAVDMAGYPDHVAVREVLASDE